jgi:hypothetical protein
MTAFIFILSLLTPPRPVHVVFVEPLGEAYSGVRAAQAQAAITAAADFWQAYADLAIVSTTIYTPTGDAYTDLSWALSLMSPEGPITIFVMDNTVSDARLPKGDVGRSQEYNHAIWVTFQGDNLDAVIAHELGHELFHLPDWYDTPGACGHPDIMCWHNAAWQRGFVGCRTLEYIGHPCKRIFLPRISS